MPITISVNVDKIDTKRFVKGKKGRYMDLILFETPESDYGDYLVKQRTDNREDDMPILGNGKFWKVKGKKSRKTAANERDDDDDDTGENAPW